MNKIIISDASCLIALDRIDKLEILHQTFTSIATTPEVKHEFGQPLPEWISIFSVTDLDKKSELEKYVDRGEASAITLAIETPESILIIDEKKGRELAKKLKLTIIGTIRVLLLAKEKGVIPAVKPILQELEKHRFRFSIHLVNQALEEANEL